VSNATFRRPAGIERAKAAPRPAPDVDSLELDIDLRTSHVWAEMEPALRSGEITLGVIASAVRVAYAQGYADCLKDQGVSLYGDNGYDVPRPERR
jgi:hypothetical protein